MLGRIKKNVGSFLQHISFKKDSPIVYTDFKAQAKVQMRYISSTKMEFNYIILQLNQFLEIFNLISVTFFCDVFSTCM